MTVSSRIPSIVLILFLLWAGHLAGFFFAWTNPAMMGFAQTSPTAYVEAMQHINHAVRNPLFFVLFFGMVPLALITVAVTRADPIVTLAALFTLAGFLITALGNVPMNNAMDSWALNALPPADEVEAFRARWQLLNTIRGVLFSIALALGLYALSPLYDLRGLLPERISTHAL